MTNYEKMTDMSRQETAIFIHDFYINHTHITVNDIYMWLGEEVKPTLLEVERILLENIKKEYKWIVRDIGGTIMLYENEPEKIGISWVGNGKVSYLVAFSHLYDFVKEEDVEPYNIKKLLEEGNEKK